MVRLVKTRIPPSGESFVYNTISAIHETLKISCPEALTVASTSRKAGTVLPSITLVLEIDAEAVCTHLISYWYGAH